MKQAFGLVIFAGFSSPPFELAIPSGQASGQVRHYETVKIVDGRRCPLPVVPTGA